MAAIPDFILQSTTIIPLREVLPAPLFLPYFKMEQGTVYASEWTEELPHGPQPCGRCGKPVAFELWKRNVNVSRTNPNAPPRHLCTPCFNHYKTKNTTVARPVGQSAAARPPPVNHLQHGPVVDVEGIARVNTGLRRPDYNYPRAPVMALPPSMPSNHHPGTQVPAHARPSASVAYNPYGHGSQMGANRGGINSAMLPPAQLPAASSVNGPAYGYSAEHQHYDAEVMKYINRQKHGITPSEHTFLVIVQLFYALEQAVIVSKANSKYVNMKRCEPILNIGETLTTHPYESGKALSVRSIALMERVLAAHAADIQFFQFDLSKASTRNVKTWADLADSAYDGGYFRADTMVPPPKKKGVNFNANALVFKAPVNTPVIGVVIPFAEYNKYLHHVAEIELNAAENECHNQSGPSFTPPTARGESPFRSLHPPQDADRQAYESGSMAPSTRGQQKKKAAPSTHGQSFGTTTSRSGSQDPLFGDESPAAGWGFKSASNGYVSEGGLSYKTNEEQAGKGKTSVGGKKQQLIVVSDDEEPSQSVQRPKKRRTIYQKPSLATGIVSKPVTTGIVQKIDAPKGLPKPVSAISFPGVDPAVLTEAIMASGSSHINPSDLDTLRTLTDNVLVFPVPVRSMPELIKIKSRSFASLLNMADAMHGILSVTAHQFDHGGFKTCHDAVIISSGDVSRMAQHFGQLSVKAKRPYIKKGKGIGRSPPAEELEEITNECNIHYWSTAFLISTYHYTDQVDEAKRKSGEERPFKVPQLRFVKAGLCCVLSLDGSAGVTRSVLAHLKKGTSISPSIRLSYMLEEAIPGQFVKYVHNGDPRPLLDPEDAEYSTAEFLCFTQHAQYILSDKKAFVSDYQGAGDLLTDPQILTNEQLGADLFGLGNVKEGFTCFEDRHICNRYCQWYGLAPFGGDQDSESTVGGKDASE